MKIIRNIALSDTGFVFNPSNGDSYSVNPIGLMILNLLKQDMPKNEIVSKLVTEYDVNEHVANNDVTDFISMLGLFKLTE